MENVDLKGPLTLQEIVSLTPTIEEFKDELGYLNSGIVREYGVKFGIVKTVCPLEYEPHDPQKQLMKKLQNSMPVLEQRFVRVTQPGKRTKSKLPVYNVERRQNEAYLTTALDFRRVGNDQQVCTDKLACKKYGKTKYESMSLREKYWATRDLQACAAYGADISGTLMKKEFEYWNFGSRTFPCLTRRYTSLRTPGVYSPYLYFGNWGTTFPLHIEDHDLYSVNYLHDGQAKVWYSVPESYATQVEELAKDLSKTESDICPNFLRHKTLMIHPDLFLQRGIPVYTTEQQAGEMIITFPKAYHFGFNSGFNIAEARNIATKDWIPVGLKVNKCTCPNSVSPTIDRQRLLEMAVEAYEEQLDQLQELTPEEVDYCTQLLQKRMKKRTKAKSSSDQGTADASKELKRAKGDNEQA
ncbi:hypothetical protein RvY_03353-2 [Ramazzottius varieornatus]|uniref:JmjC domain-containing protein n=1 Tax=Ramazzottius varieornatus TaxID=947166 RepID=A0A1D1UMS4_RAMVA|nr:hypothetical protein RvY_03353-2 [Ramazzottius varieornatus]